MNTLAFLGSLGPWEIAIIALVALLLFGRRLPEVGKNLGRGIVEFKKGLRDAQDEITKEPDPAAAKPAGQADEIAGLRAEIERLKAAKNPPPSTHN